MSALRSAGGSPAAASSSWRTPPDPATPQQPRSQLSLPAATAVVGGDGSQVRSVAGAAVETEVVGAGQDDRSRAARTAPGRTDRSRGRADRQSAGRSAQAATDSRTASP